MNLMSLLQRARSSRPIRVLTFLVVVALLALASSFVTRDVRLATGSAPGDLDLIPQATAWFLWLGLLWIFIGLRTFVLPRLGSRFWARPLGELCLCASYCFVAVEMTLLLAEIWGPPPLPAGLSIEDLFPMMMIRAASMYALIVIAMVAIQGEVERRRSVREAKELAHQQETLERQLVAARLQSLQSQLQPHFLFNALHAIGGVILTGDRQQAHRALASLSNLLRESLRQSKNPMATVEEELDLVNEYIGLERLRFGDRMEFSVEAQPEVLHEEVPALILLPLVENAVKHGLEPRSGGGRIEIAAQVRAGVLSLSVLDDGVGRSESKSSSENGMGIGLSNTAGRLDALYGSEAGVEVEDREAGGTRVTIELPARKSTDPLTVEVIS